MNILSSIVDCCSNRIVSAPLLPNQKVSVTDINQNFNDVVCADFFWLDKLSLFHAIDSYYRFFAVILVKSTGLTEAIVGFETIWMTQFWQPGAVQGDLVFRFDEFRPFIDQYDIVTSPVPRRRHHKNLLKPKHGSSDQYFTVLSLPPRRSISSYSLLLPSVSLMNCIVQKRCRPAKLPRVFQNQSINPFYRNSHLSYSSMLRMNLKRSVSLLKCYGQKSLAISSSGQVN